MTTRASSGVVVLGSVNTDIVLQVSRRPAPGETVGDAVLTRHPGGKGANQAVAAARCGARVSMIGCVGDDAEGAARRAELEEAGVATASLSVAPGATGTAVITVTPDGQNAIIVVPGANARVDSARVDAARDAIGAAAVLVAQLEVSREAVARAASLLDAGARFILNASPVRLLPDTLFERVDVLVVNETEAAEFAGVAVRDAAGAASAGVGLRARGARAVVVTLGAAGAVIVDEDGSRARPAPAAEVRDTTGAGDAFVGTLAAWLSAGATLDDAVACANVVGAATTEREGASPVIPAGLVLPTTSS